MCRDQLIRTISIMTGQNMSTVRAILDAFQDITTEKLIAGESVSLHGFGVFEIKSRSPRLGRNPHTGEPVEIPARALPGFTPSDALKAKVSGKSPEKKPATKSPRNSPAK